MMLQSDGTLLLGQGEVLPTSLTDRYKQSKTNPLLFEIVWPSCCLRVIRKIDPRCVHSRQAEHCTLTNQQISVNECRRCDKRLPTTED